MAKDAPKLQRIGVYDPYSPRSFGERQPPEFAIQEIRETIAAFEERAKRRRGAGKRKEQPVDPQDGKFFVAKAKKGGSKASPQGDMPLEVSGRPISFLD